MRGVTLPNIEVNVKIAILTCEYAPYPGGIANYTRELAKAAFAQGIEPTVFHAVERIGKVPEDGFRVKRIPPTTYNHWKLPILSTAFWKELRKDAFDCVLAADLQSMLALSIVPISAPKLAAVHGTDINSRLLRYVSCSRVFQPLTIYDRILSNSKFTRDRLVATHPYLDQHKCKVAHLGVDSFWAEEPSDEDYCEVNEKFGLDDNRIVVVSVGRLEWRKGHLQAIAAISKLPKIIQSKITYLIIGNPVEREYVDELKRAALSSIADIRLTGVLPATTIRSLYKRAKILLHTATADRNRVEGFGLVILEAAAAGLPCVGTRVDALPEVVLDGRTGFLLPDGNVEAIKNKIEKILCSRSLSKSIGGNAKEYSKNFNWKDCVRKTFDIGN